MREKISVRIIELENDKIHFVADKLMIDSCLFPSVGDIFYFKGLQQWKVVERQFNLNEASLYDVELIVEKVGGVK